MASESSNANLADRVDDDYFLLNHEAVELQEAMSDLKYADGLQLQEVISDDIRTTFSLPPSHDAAAIIGECSSASSSSSSRSSIDEFFCKICMEAVPRSDEHRASPGCAHAFCAACLAGYIGSKIKDRIADVRCPEEGCGGVLDPALCQGILPREVFERWDASLSESMVLGAKRAYCPFKGCLEMMVMDDGDVAESECPSCKGHFCAQCGVPWHAGSDCAAYRKLGKGDTGKEDTGKEDMTVLKKMAEEKKWKSCPGCKQMVEKVDGCSHITCRCGYEFCYGCGVNRDGNGYPIPEYPTGFIR